MHGGEVAEEVAAVEGGEVLEAVLWDVGGLEGVGNGRMVGAYEEGGEWFVGEEAVEEFELFQGW